MADNSQKHRLELGIEFLAELLLFLYPYGAEQMGLPHNFWLGLSCWIVGTAIAIRMFWIFPVWADRISNLVKGIIAVALIAVFILLFYRPVMVAYGKRNVTSDAASPPVPPEPPKPTSPQAQEQVPNVPPATKVTKVKTNKKEETPKSPKAPSASDNGGAVGSITLGPGSIAQVGGTNNTAIIQGSQDWLLTGTQQLDLKDALSKSHGRVRMSWWQQDTKSIRYAEALLWAFDKAGWKLENQVPGYIGSACFPTDDWDCLGLGITVRDRSGDVASTVIAALSSLSIPYHITMSDKNDEDLIDVFVTKAPK